MEIKEPFYVFHEIVEHDTIKTGYQILHRFDLAIREGNRDEMYLERQRSPKACIPKEEKSIYELVLCNFTLNSLLR